MLFRSGVHVSPTPESGRELVDVDEAPPVGVRLRSETELGLPGLRLGEQHGAPDTADLQRLVDDAGEFLASTDPFQDLLKERSVPEGDVERTDDAGAAPLGIDRDHREDPTIVTALLCGSPAYGQTKFNVLSYGMTHSTTTTVPTSSRRPGSTPSSPDRK